MYIYSKIQQETYIYSNKKKKMQIKHAQHHTHSHTHHVTQKQIYTGTKKQKKSITLIIRENPTSIHLKINKFTNTNPHTLIERNKYSQKTQRNTK